MLGAIAKTGQASAGQHEQVVELLFAYADIRWATQPFDGRGHGIRVTDHQPNRRFRQGQDGRVQLILIFGVDLPDGNVQLIPEWFGGILRAAELADEDLGDSRVAQDVGQLVRPRNAQFIQRRTSLGIVRRPVGHVRVPDEND